MWRRCAAWKSRIVWTADCKWEQTWRLMEEPAYHSLALCMLLVTQQQLCTLQPTSHLAHAQQHDVTVDTGHHGHLRQGRVLISFQQQLCAQQLLSQLAIVTKHMPDCAV